MKKCPHSLTPFDSLGLVTRGQTTNKKAVTSSIIEPDTAVPLSCKAEPQIASTQFCYAKPSLIRNPSALNNSLFLLHFWWIWKRSQIWNQNEARDIFHLINLQCLPSKQQNIRNFLHSTNRTMEPSNYESSPKQAKHWSSDSYLCNHIYKWLSVSGPDATCDTKLGASHDNMSSLMLSLVSVRKLRAMIIFHFTHSLWAGEETVLVLSNISTKSSVSCDCLIKTQTASCCLLAEFSASPEIPARSYFVCRALEKSVLVCVV